MNSSRRICFFPIFLVTLLLFSGCTSAFPTEADPSLKETQLELNVQQTLAAQGSADTLNATLESQRATLDAQFAQATRLAEVPTVDTAAIAQQTVAAQHAAETALAISNPPSTDTPTPLPQPTADFNAWMKTANILVFEDMTSRLDTNRYVKDTLDLMGIKFTDSGSAAGLLKSKLLSGGPTGQGWDLVIIASESKDTVNAELFGHVNTALQQGASVIFEVWYLNDMAAGAGATMMNDCGIEFDKDWSKVPPSRLVMFAVNSTNPIMLQPNNSLRFTDTTSYWWDPDLDIDIGDWIRLATGSEAQILISAVASEPPLHGTVVSCFNNRLILQSFSSHQLTYKAMKPVWENYIYNTLKARFDYVQP